MKQLDLEDYLKTLSATAKQDQGFDGGMFSALVNEFRGHDGPFATVLVWDATTDDRLAITCKTPEEFISGWTRSSNAVRGEQHTWGGKYLFHDEDRPAISFFDGSSAHFERGLVHNTEGPAIRSKNIDLYCLNGKVLPKEHFESYKTYALYVSKRSYPSGAVPTFPHSSEIEEAVKNGLVLCFDLGGNFRWYDADGLLHHPSQPAVERTDGVLEYWRNGSKEAESTLSSSGLLSRLGLTRQELEEITTVVRDNLEQALKASKDFIVLDSVEDILSSGFDDEVFSLFRHAGEMLQDGEMLDDVMEWFEAHYDALAGEPGRFARRFSQELREGFSLVIEDVWDAKGWYDDKQKIVPQDEKEGVFKRAKPTKPPSRKTLIKRGITKDQLIASRASQHLEEENRKADSAMVDVEPENVGADHIRYVGDVKIELVSSREPEILDAVVEETDELLAALADEEGLSEEELDEEISHLEEELAPKTPTTPSSPGWGLPLGMLALAGVVGALTKQKPHIAPEIVKETAEAIAKAG